MNGCVGAVISQGMQSARALNRTQQLNATSTRARLKEMPNSACLKDTTGWKLEQGTPAVRSAHLWRCAHLKQVTGQLPRCCGFEERGWGGRAPAALLLTPILTVLLPKVLRAAVAQARLQASTRVLTSRWAGEAGEQYSSAERERGHFERALSSE